MGADGDDAEQPSADYNVMDAQSSERGRVFSAPATEVPDDHSERMRAGSQFLKAWGVNVNGTDPNYHGRGIVPRDPVGSERRAHEIAADHGTTLATLRAKSKSARGKVDPLDGVRIETAQVLKRESFATEDIAATLGRSPSTIKEWCKGVKTPKQKSDDPDDATSGDDLDSIRAMEREIRRDMRRKGLL